MNKVESNYRLIFDELLMMDNITLIDSVVYGTIISFLSKSGLCYATNQTMASQVKLSRSSISKSVNKLKNEGLIEVIIVLKPGSKQVIRREIRLIIKYIIPRKKLTKEEIRAKLMRGLLNAQ